MNPGPQPLPELAALVNSVTRYTRFVRSTKVGLGFLAVLLVALILFYPLFRQQQAGVRISFNGTTRKEVPDPTSMKSPRFHGVDKDNQIYNMAAAQATEMDSDRIALAEPSGDILLKSGHKLQAKSLTGIYNKKAQTLALKGKVEMSTDQGYTMTTETMAADLAHNSAATSSEVYGQGELGTLKAYGGAMVDGVNQQILFLGPVFVTLNMDKKAPKEK